MSEPAVDSVTLLMKRQLNAKPERVFEAFTQPEVLMKWWGPEGCACPGADVDLRVGGSYRLQMQTENYGLIAVHGQYREIIPNKKLCYTWNWEGIDHETKNETLVTLTFDEVDGGTELTLLHELFPSESARDSHNQGWTSCFNCLERLLGA